VVISRSSATDYVPELDQEGRKGFDQRPECIGQGLARQRPQQLIGNARVLFSCQNGKRRTIRTADVKIDQQLAPQKGKRDDPRPGFPFPGKGPEVREREVNADVPTRSAFVDQLELLHAAVYPSVLVYQ